MIVEQAVVQTTSAFLGGPGYAWTVEEQDGDCVVCPNDEEMLAVQVYEEGEWRSCRAGEDYDPTKQCRWGDGYGYPWTHFGADS